MTRNISMPKVALILGWGGVIPFVGTALAWLFGDPILRFHALNIGTIYGGVIIAFLGAVHWGLATQHQDDQHPARGFQFFWSVLPALAVVPVLTVAPMIRPPFLLAGLIICWGVDMYAASKGTLPTGYLKLRHGLTAVATICMLILMRY